MKPVDERKTGRVTIILPREQADIYAEAKVALEQELGVARSHNQVVALLCKRYVNLRAP
jgi:hypothetical protein